MKKSYLILIILLAASVVVGLLLSQRSTPENKSAVATTTVLMKKDVFEPETVTIKKGATVEFKNMDSVARWPASNLHPTHTIYPQFDPRQPIDPGQSWQFTFEKEGQWKYHDHLIPSIRGTITVTD